MCSSDLIAAAVAAVPDGAQLVLGNSLPVRTIDEVTDGGRDLRVLTQRGAAGIDGLVAGAAGAAATGTPTVLVLGDVSFAHDAGSLTIARHLPLAIVVVDNGGGRIFDELPVAHAVAAADLERLWRTPTGLDPVAIARAYGLAATRATDAASLHAAVATALATHQPTVVHVPVVADSARAVRVTALAELARAVPSPAARAAVIPHHGASP